MVKRIQKATTRFSEHELCNACERIADVVSQGQPLDQDTLRAASFDPTQPSIMRAIAAELESGLDISDVLPLFARKSAGTLRAAVLAGQASGALDDTLVRWVRMRKAVTHCKKASWGALVYPALLAVTFLVSVVFVFQFVVPQYVTIVQGSGQVPPLIQVLSWLRSNLWIVIAGTLLVLSIPFVWAVAYVHRSASQRTSLDTVAMQQFAARLAALMMRQSVPLATANPLLQLASGDSVLNGETSTSEGAAIRSPTDAASQSRVHPLLRSVVNELDSGSISREQAMHFVEKIASQLAIQCNRAAVSRVGWLSTVVTVMVAVGAAGIYIILIYLPWTQVLMQLEETGR